VRRRRAIWKLDEWGRNSGWKTANRNTKRISWGESALIQEKRMGCGEHTTLKKQGGTGGGCHK